MAPKKDLPRSKHQILCGYCGVEMRRDRLGEHTKNHCKKNKNRNRSKEYGSRSIADMFARTPTPAALGTPTPEERGVSEEDMPPPTARAMSPATEPTTTRKRRRSDSPCSSSDDLDDDDTIPCKRSKSNESNPILEKIDTVLSSLSELKISVDSIGPAIVAQRKDSGAESKPSTSSSDQSLAALRVLIQNCKSLHRLCELAGVTHHDEATDVLCCDVCVSSNENSQGSTSNQSHGVFGYDFSLGKDFTAESQPQKFINLKKSVAKHIGTQNHRNMSAKNEQETEELRKYRAKQQSVGLTVGKQAYKAVKLGRPFSDFETDLQLMSAANVNVGNMNHSRQFPSKMRASFATAIDTRIKHYIASPLPATGTVPPVGIIADKVTTRRRTGHMYGGILFTPNMPNLLTPVSLGMVAVKGHDGESIANDVKDVCNQYSLQSDQIAGFGFDGQYFNLHVPEKLKEKLHLDDNVTFQWDPAHLLQLADKDMRKEVPWIETICKDVAAVLHKFAYGKTFEAAIDKADELGIDMKAPLWFSETRFAAYAHLVFRNFTDNYAIVRSVLEEIAEKSDPRADEADQLLGRIRTISFVARVILLMDFYRVLGEVSQIFQRVDAPIWVKARSLKYFMETLDKMTSWDGDEQYKYYRTHEASLSTGEFASFPVLITHVGVTRPFRRTRQQDEDEFETDSDQVVAKLDQIKQQLSTMTAVMSLKVKERFPDAFFDKIRDKENAASLMPILARAKSSENESDVLQSDEFHTLVKMHPTQSEAVRNLCQNISRHKSSLQNCQTDIQIYHKVFSEPSLYIGAQHILATIAKIICSSPPESVVESMGSVIEKIRQVRGGFKSSTNQQDIKDMSDELIVHWNGPPFSLCHSIVRQALNIHFHGHSWHFIATDVRARMHKVSLVVDRLNGAKANLTFMN